jgi:hypothetical protein
MLKRLLTIVLMFSVLAACKQTVAPDAKTALELFCAHKGLYSQESATADEHRSCIDHLEADDLGIYWSIQLHRKYWQRTSTGFYGQPIWSLSQETGKIIGSAVVD